MGLTEHAEQALAARDPGRAIALAQQALSAGEPRLPLFRIEARALAKVLVRTGLILDDLTAGAIRPRVLSEGTHREAMRELVSELQRALYGMAAEREARALPGIFTLAGSITDVDVVRRPRSSHPSGIVVSMLCCDRIDLLRQTLASLLASDLEPAELVFFEDASRDPRVLETLTELDARTHRIHVLRNRGFSTRSWPSNQNAVIDYVQREIGEFEMFVTCDADMLIAPTWWGSVTTIYRAVAGLRLPEGRLGVITAFHAEDSHPSTRMTTVGGVTFRIKETLGGCQIVVPREVYDTVLGPLDHLSDWGWSARLRASGRFVATTVPSHCQHLGSDSLLYHTVADTAPDFVAG